MRLLPLVFIALLFTACDSITGSGSSEFVPVEINQQYVIDLPKYMSEAKDLNDEASLQYQNIFKETYSIVIDEPKEEFIQTFEDIGDYDSNVSVVENYRNIQLNYIIAELTLKSQSEPESLKINGMDASRVEVDGEVEGIDYGITYFLTFIEGKENMYMVMAWTLSSRKDTYREDFATSAKSFRLFGDEAPKDGAQKKEAKEEEEAAE